MKKLPLSYLFTCLLLPSGVHGQAQSPPIPPRLLIPVSRYDIRGEVAPIEESKVLNEPLGLPRLRTTPLPVGVREIRIYEGLVIGYPHSGLIVRDDHGKVTGRLVRYWPRNDTVYQKDVDAEKLYERDEAERCSKPVRGKEASVCTVKFLTEPDWGKLLHSLDELHAWDLPDESRVPKSATVFDGWVIRVEARRDTLYTRYQYHNPEIYQPPYGPSALAIMGIVDSLFRYTTPPSNLEFVHGILTYGRDTSDFASCAPSGMKGFMTGRIYPIAKVIGDSIYRSHVGPTMGFEIEGWAHRGDEPKEYYHRRFERTWFLDSMTVMRQSPERTCSH